MSSKTYKRVAILCNGNSSIVTDRVDLISALHKHNIQPYTVGIYDGTIHSYYKKENSLFIPVIASRSNTNPLYEIKSILSVAKQMRRNKIDAAIIYGVKNHPAMALGCRLGKVKNILCVVNGSGNLFRIKGGKGTILRLMSFPMLKIAYRLSKCVGFQNKDDKLLFSQKHLITKNSNAFIMNGSGVNLDKFPQRPLPKNGSVLFLSRIAPSKGLYEFIEAAYKIRSMGYDATFDIVGPLDGIIEKDSDKALKKAMADGVINYHGETTDVSGWMGKSKIFVYPSYYPEGVPRCVLQAMATGRPIITCDTPGCRVTVKDGDNGYLVRPQDSDDLSDKIAILLGNEMLVAKMAEASRKMAETSFDVNIINEILISKLLK